MAGWRKNYQNGNQFVKGNLIVTIQHSISVPKDKWGVRVYNTSTEEDKYKYFNTRPQALKFAKSYMRKH